MERNKIIQAALIACKVIRVILAVMALALTVVLIHWHITPDAYSNVEVSNALGYGYGSGGFHLILSERTSSLENEIYLSNLESGMIWWLYIRFILFIALTILILNSLVNVLGSIRSLDTFRSQNVAAFRQIGRWLLVIFILSCFNFSYINGQMSLEFGVSTTQLLLALSAFVLAEIFKEGNRLMEENSLTI